MKNVCILVVLILSFNSLSQNEQNIITSPETNKKGVVQSNKDVSQPTIPFIYEDIIRIGDQFILIDTIIYTKKKVNIIAK